MLIRIYLKSGNVLPDFPCDEFTVERSKITGEITGYEFKGGMIPRPVYVAIAQVEAICRVDTVPMPDNDRVAELEQELARAMFYISAQKECNTCKYEKCMGARCCGDCMFCGVDGCRCRHCHKGELWEWVGIHGSK